jgi:hypothetical protein
VSDQVLPTCTRHQGDWGMYQRQEWKIAVIAVMLNIPVSAIADDAIVAECVKEVQQKFNDRSFDAYQVPGTPTIKWMGSADENFAFEKCMVLHGITFDR